MHTVWTVVALGYISLQALFWPESQCFFGGGSQYSQLESKPQ